jgi:hypothetical protein
MPKERAYSTITRLARFPDRYGAATLAFQLQRHFLFATARSRVELKNPCSSVFICG